MLHLTRKTTTIAVRAGCAFSLVALFTAFLPPFAWAENTPEERSSTLLEQTNARLINGEQTTEPNEKDPSSKPLPRGEIAKVTPGSTVIFILYLPMLPIIDKDGWYCGDNLESLRLERAYADNPNNWSEYALIKWDNNSNYYYAIDPLSESGFNQDIYIPPPYYNNFCTVICNEPMDSYRDFFLRVTAVTTSEETKEEKTYGPVSFIFPDSMKPAPDDKPTTKPSDPDDGSSGGNRGNVSPGESERVDPSSTPADLLPDIEKAQAAESGTSESVVTPGVEHEPTNEEKALEVMPLSSGSEIPTKVNTETLNEYPTEPANRIPGFLQAIGATMMVAIATIIVFAFRKRLAKLLK